MNDEHKEKLGNIFDFKGKPCIEGKTVNVYRPENYPGPIALEAKAGFKFCQDTILLKSFLDQRNIQYDINELEMTPFGLGLRLKKDNGE